MEPYHFAYSCPYRRIFIQPFRVLKKALKYTEGIKVNNLVGILHIISHIDFKAPTGLIAHMISSNSLRHPNIEVEEYAIKCYENWDSEVGLDELKKVSFKKKWIQEYADQVIMDIEEEN